MKIVVADDKISEVKNLLKKCLYTLCIYKARCRSYTKNITVRNQFENCTAIDIVKACSQSKLGEHHNQLSHYEV